MNIVFHLLKPYPDQAVAHEMELWKIVEVFFLQVVDLERLDMDDLTMILLLSEQSKLARIVPKLLVSVPRDISLSTSALARREAAGVVGNCTLLAYHHLSATRAKGGRFLFPCLQTGGVRLKWTMQRELKNCAEQKATGPARRGWPSLVMECTG